MLALPEEMLVAQQLKRAHELKDVERVRNREVRSPALHALPTLPCHGFAPPAVRSTPSHCHADTLPTVPR